MANDEELVGKKRLPLEEGGNTEEIGSSETVSETPEKEAGNVKTSIRTAVDYLRERKKLVDREGVKSEEHAQVDEVTQSAERLAQERSAQVDAAASGETSADASRDELLEAARKKIAEIHAKEKKRITSLLVRFQALQERSEVIVNPMIKFLAESETSHNTMFDRFQQYLQSAQLLNEHQILDIPVQYQNYIDSVHSEETKRFEKSLEECCSALETECPATKELVEEVKPEVVEGESVTVAEIRTRIEHSIERMKELLVRWDAAIRVLEKMDIKMFTTDGLRDVRNTWLGLGKSESESIANGIKHFSQFLEKFNEAVKEDGAILPDQESAIKKYETAVEDAVSRVAKNIDSLKEFTDRVSQGNISEEEVAIMSQALTIIPRERSLMAASDEQALEVSKTSRTENVDGGGEPPRSGEGNAESDAEGSEPRRWRVQKMYEQVNGQLRNVKLDFYALAPRRFWSGYAVGFKDYLHPNDKALRPIAEQWSRLSEHYDQVTEILEKFHSGTIKTLEGFFDMFDNEMEKVTAFLHDPFGLLGNKGEKRKVGFPTDAQLDDFETSVRNILDYLRNRIQYLQSRFDALASDYHAIQRGEKVAQVRESDVSPDVPKIPGDDSITASVPNAEGMRVSLDDLDDFQKGSVPNAEGMRVSLDDLDDFQKGTEVTDATEVASDASSAEKISSLDRVMQDTTKRSDEMRTKIKIAKEKSEEIKRQVKEKFEGVNRETLSNDVKELLEIFDRESTAWENTIESTLQEVNNTQQNVEDAVANPDRNQEISTEDREEISDIGKIQFQQDVDIQLSALEVKVGVSSLSLLKLQELARQLDVINLTVDTHEESDSRLVTENIHQISSLKFGVGVVEVEFPNDAKTNEGKNLDSIHYSIHDGASLSRILGLRDINFPIAEEVLRANKNWHIRMDLASKKLVHDQKKFEPIPLADVRELSYDGMTEELVIATEKDGTKEEKRMKAE